MQQEEPGPADAELLETDEPTPEPDPRPNTLVATSPNHVWRLDFTWVPMFGGNWLSAFPFAAPVLFPFGYWVAGITDQFSRHCMELKPFRKNPSTA